MNTNEEVKLSTSEEVKLDTSREVESETELLLQKETTGQEQNCRRTLSSKITLCVGVNNGVTTTEGDRWARAALPQHSAQ